MTNAELALQKYYSPKSEIKGLKRLNTIAGIRKTIGIKDAKNNPEERKGADFSRKKLASSIMKREKRSTKLE